MDTDHTTHKSNKEYASPPTQDAATSPLASPDEVASLRQPPSHSAAWQDVLDRAGISIDELKRALPLQYVINQAGVALEANGSRLVGLCPFHADTNPSFAVFGDELETCGCWTCEFTTGDHFDFIQRQWGVTFTSAVEQGVAFLEAFKADPDWEPLRAEHEVTVSPETFMSHAQEAYQHPERSRAIETLMLLKQQQGDVLSIPSDWLTSEWWVGGINTETVYIPHFEVEPGSAAVKAIGAKTRYNGLHPYAEAGSKFTALYGQWRDQRRQEVIVCEGESDTWWVSYIMRNEPVDVLGLPTGVGTPCRAEWQDYLEGRDVTLFFDGDEAGRSGARRWAEGLMGRSRSIRVAVMRANADACRLGIRELRDVLRNAVPVMPWTPEVSETARGYVWSKDERRITDWTLKPLLYLDLDAGFGFQGLLDGQPVTVTSADFMTPQRLTEWANRHGRHYFGTQRHLQHLLKHLALQEPFLPAGKGTERLGWHAGSFVTPVEVIGAGAWTFVGSPSEDEFHRIVTLDRRQGDPRTVIPLLLGLHRRNVITPILAWLCVAVMRPEFREFPILFVKGPSGSGKTTLVDAILSSLGFGGGEHNLTSSTRYGLATMMTGSCGVPVWIDEYRPGGSNDAQRALQQLVRDAWTMGSSVRGGMREKRTLIGRTPVTAPILVSGEDVFSETSLWERSIEVGVSHDGRNPQALRTLRQQGQIGRTFLEWLVDNYTMSTIDRTTRWATSESILKLGWDTFARWASEWGLEVGDLELPQQDDDRVNPLIDLLLWGVGQQDRNYNNLVWNKDDRLAIRLRELRKAAREHGFTPPGGERAIKEHLESIFGESTHDRVGKLRSTLFPPGSWTALVEHDASLEPTE